VVQVADIPEVPALGLPTTIEVDEAAARRTLREQISRLERLLGEQLVSAFGQGDAPAAAQPTRRATGPRLLSLGELDALRDDLAERLRQARAATERRADDQERARVLLEKMRLDPRAYKYVRVSHADLGQPGCWSWHAKPRLGVIGMLAGWWHVKLSSGCPRPT
jgi:hypothetical protein